MKLYCSLESEKGGRTAKKGGDMFIEITLSAYGKKIGEIVLETNTDANDVENQYHVKYHPSFSDEWYTIEEGHKKEGVIQRMR